MDCTHIFLGGGGGLLPFELSERSGPASLISASGQSAAPTALTTTVETTAGGQ